MRNQQTALSSRARLMVDRGVASLEFRLPVPLVQRIDDWRSGLDDAPTRAEAVRRLLVAGLDAKKLSTG